MFRNLPRLVQGESIITEQNTVGETGARFCLTMPKVERPLKSAGWRKLKVPFQRAR